ncbi:MAG: bud emergence protein 1 [Piccolia ochrophora]|nr:MAG: bud emergence protein 1 [Piccolia ochrophora]
MKAIRRSMKSDKTEPKVHQHHISLTPKDAIAILPPKKVIRALYDYEADPEHKHELSFARGDFFHVIGRENDDDWYEACNPSMPNARGLVPVRFFQVLGKTERDSAGSTLSTASTKVRDANPGYAERPQGNRTPAEPNGTSQPIRLSKSMGKGSGAMVYGIVMYDFAAERQDELDAKAGEAIIVIAQSNPEWFVAKPIGRLGGPGLIPVSFIEIRDMSSGQAVPNAHEAVQRAGVPKVEEWKKLAADYKNSSITLGKFESGMRQQQTQSGMERLSLNNATGRESVGQTNGMNSQDFAAHNGGYIEKPMLRRSTSQLPYPVSASIPRWCFANEKYWYIIEAVMSDGKHWELARFYQDFYDFQIGLLTLFSEEAGNAGKPRILPFMPGPVTYVTDQISRGRQQNLDEYIKKLLDMPFKISRCPLVCQLFAPREGDYELDPDAPAEDFNRLSGASLRSSNEYGDDPSGQSSRANGYQPGLTPAPPRSNHQRQQQSISNGQGDSHYRMPSDAQNSQLDRQSIPQNQHSNGSLAASNAAGGGAMKIKINYQNDLIAIRVPVNISFPQLLEKVKSRINVGDDIEIQYRDEASNRNELLRNDQDLDFALQRNPKLTLQIL